MYISVYVCVCTSICVYVHIVVCIFVYVCMHKCMCGYPCVHAYGGMYICVYMCVCVCVYVDICEYEHICCCSVVVMSDSPTSCTVAQHQFPLPSLSPRCCSNSCALGHWCYLTISSSATLFSYCFQSFPASGSFPMSWLFTSGSQSIGTSASVFPMNIQGCFPLGLSALISLLSSPRDSQESSPAPQFESINSLALSLLYGPILTSIHDYWKNHSFD